MVIAKVPILWSRLIPQEKYIYYGLVCPKAGVRTPEYTDGSFPVFLRPVFPDPLFSWHTLHAKAFANDPPTTVFLLSVRSGAVGINLTQANNVFLLEPVSLSVFVAL